MLPAQVRWGLEPWPYKHAVEVPPNLVLVLSAHSTKALLPGMAVQRVQ